MTPDGAVFKWFRSFSLPPGFVELREVGIRECPNAEGSGYGPHVLVDWAFA